MSALKDRLIGAAYGLGWTLACRMPESWARWVFELAGGIAWRRQGPRVQILEANLRRVVGPGPSGPELRALSRAAMLSYARYWMEVFRLPVISQERIVENTLSIGEEKTLHANLAAGRGVVVVLPHMGNWEEAGAWIIARGAGRFTTVAEGGMIGYEGSRLMVALRDVSARFRFAHPLNLFSGTVRWI